MDDDATAKVVDALIAGGLVGPYARGRDELAQQIVDEGDGALVTVGVVRALRRQAQGQGTRNVPAYIGSVLAVAQERRRFLETVMIEEVEHRAELRKDQYPEHIPNMPLGAECCNCENCVKARAKR